MITNNINEIIGYDLEKCPKCDEPHHFKLKVNVPAKADEKVMLFGGAAKESEVLFTCPNTNQKFTRLVPAPPHGEIAGLASEADISQLSPAIPKPSPVDNEFKEWIKNSRKTALDFCKTMLSISTGAIPVFFAVLKYIGFEKIGSTGLAKFTILPPVFFLVAAILYVLALRPRYKGVTQSAFNAFRARRLGQLNQYIIWGTATFAGATGLAIAIFFYALSQ